MHLYNMVEYDYETKYINNCRFRKRIYIYINNLRLITIHISEAEIIDFHHLISPQDHQTH